MLIVLLLGIILLAAIFLLNSEASVVNQSILYKVPYESSYLWIIHSLYFAAVVLPNIEMM